MMPQSSLTPEGDTVAFPSWGPMPPQCPFKPRGDKRSPLSVFLNLMTPLTQTFPWPLPVTPLNEPSILHETLAGAIG